MYGPSSKVRAIVPGIAQWVITAPKGNLEALGWRVLVVVLVLALRGAFLRGRFRGGVSERVSEGVSKGGFPRGFHTVGWWRKVCCVRGAWSAERFHHDYKVFNSAGGVLKSGFRFI